MTTFLVIIHVMVSLFLIFIVLIQGGKGAELGAAFGGGSSHTLFGSRGAATFLNKITTVVAIVFMATSLLLAIASVRSTSIIQKNVPANESPAAGASLPAGSPALPQTPSGEQPAQASQQSAAPQQSLPQETPESK